MSDNNGIIIFTKNPELGKVKTRLAKEVGDEKALDIYIQLLEYTKEVVQNCQASKHLFYSNSIRYNDRWPDDKFEKYLQSKGDLGDRMLKAFDTVLRKNQKAVIIGSDCPMITPVLIQQAFASLDQKDLVIGPTFDGGYYLLGSKTQHPFLFENMPWSSGLEFEETLRRSLRHQLTVDVLETLSDIDYLEDWEQYGLE